MYLAGYCTEPFICAVMFCVLRYDLRAPLLALCLTSHLILCIVPFLSLRPKKRHVRCASHIASRLVPRFFTLFVLAKLLCHSLYIFPSCAASVILGNSR